MALKKIAILVVIIATAVIGYFYFQSTPYLQTVDVDDMKSPASSKAPQNLTESSNTSDTKTAQQDAQTLIQEQLADQIAWVAQAYEQQSRYPSYSIPVTDVELAMPTPPFAEARVEMKTFSRDGDLLPISVAASLDKLNYVMGETITIQMQLSGADSNTSVFANANLKETRGKNLLPQDLVLRPLNKNQAEYRASIDSNDIDLDGASQELIARIEVELDGEQFVTTVPFFLSKASANIENIGNSEQKGAHLLIPLEYDVFESGYYFVSAYLDDAKTNRPLLALQAEGRLSKGSDELVLKAHQQALKDSGSQGPYKLRITSSFRGAEDNELADVQTAVAKTSFDVQDFSFDGYTDAPFSDPLVEQRLEAIKKLSGND